MNKHEKYPLYSPSLEDKSFFDWPMQETALTRKSVKDSKTTRPAIIRPKVNISEKAILDRIKKLGISSVLDSIFSYYNVTDKQKREINVGGKYYRWIGTGHQVTKELVVEVIKSVFDEYREKEQLRKEKELAETKPEVVVLNASELLHSDT
jgi:hypothetical protein